MLNISYPGIGEIKKYQCHDLSITVSRDDFQFEISRSDDLYVSEEIFVAACMDMNREITAKWFIELREKLVKLNPQLAEETDRVLSYFYVTLYDPDDWNVALDYMTDHFPAELNSALENLYEQTITCVDRGMRFCVPRFTLTALNRMETKHADV